MGLFRKSTKYSKSSKDLDNKIKNLDEDLKKTGVTISESDVTFLSEEKSKDEKCDWRKELSEHKIDEETLIEEYVNEIRDKHRKLWLVEDSIESIKIREARNIFRDLYQDQVEQIVEKYVSSNSADIVTLREDLFLELNKRPKVDLADLEEKIDLLSRKYRRLSEGLLNDTSKTNDPLQNSVTLEQLKNHYQLLVGRLQEQLATLGGGGEVRLKYLDDVVGVATNGSAYDGKYLRYNHNSGTFEFTDISSIGIATEIQTLNNVLQLGNTSAIGMSVGVVTATSFYGDGSSLSGIVTTLVGLASEGYVDSAVAGVSTFSGDYNDLTNAPSIPSIVGLASEGYVDAAVSGVSGVSTFSGSYNDLTDKPTIPSIVGLASEGYVDAAVSGVSTFSGSYNDLTDKPTIPSIVGLASEGYVDTAVAGVSTFSGDYNDLINTPSIPSIVGLASEGYVDTAVAGVSTFSGDYNDLINTPSIPSIVGLASEGYVDSAVAGISTTAGNVVDIKDGGSTIGVAGTIDFGTNLSVSAISAGVVTVTATAGGVVGSAGTWAVNAIGIHTSKNVGINTTLSTDALTVVGDGNFTGVVTATRFESTSSGTPSIDSPNNLNINAVNVAISTDLSVGRDAYVGVNTSAGLVLTDALGVQWRLGVTTTGSLFTTLV